MKFRPLYDRALLKRAEEQHRTAGGVIIPDTAQENATEAEVIAVGPGRRRKDGSFEPIDLKVGNRVLLGKWSGTEVTIDGEDYLILMVEDVLGILENGAEAVRAA